MDKMTDSRAVEALAAMTRGLPSAFAYAEKRAALNHAIARLREPAEAQRCTCPSGDGSLRWPCPAHPAEAQPTPIGDLLADYEANGCDFTDLVWVRAASRGYVKTMPDSQVRCLLHVLAQTTAEAQAQGGGEAKICDCVGWQRCDKCVQKLACPPITAPPSAPVGVDRLVRAVAAAKRERDETRELSATTMGEMWLALDALAQQPAAEAERKFFSQDFYEEAREGKKPWPDQQPAAVPALEVFRIAGGDTECDPNPTPERALEVLRDLRACYDDALATQPGGSDND